MSRDQISVITITHTTHEMKDRSIVLHALKLSAFCVDRMHFCTDIVCSLHLHPLALTHSLTLSDRQSVRQRVECSNGNVRQQPKEQNIPSDGIYRSLIKVNATREKNEEKKKKIQSMCAFELNVAERAVTNVVREREGV